MLSLVKPCVHQKEKDYRFSILATNEWKCFDKIKYFHFYHFLHR